MMTKMIRAKLYSIENGSTLARLTALCLNCVKSDFFKHKTVKTNDKIRRLGVVMTPLSRKNIYQIMQITAFTAILARRINIQGCEHYQNIFARMESDCTLRFGFKALIVSLVYEMLFISAVICVI